MNPVGISLAEAAELVPLSKSSLYRVAEAGGDESPFTKRCGKWITTPERLREWIETGPKPRSRSIGNPMPKAARPNGGDFLAEVFELRKETA